MLEWIMLQVTEALRILRQNHIPYRTTNTEGIAVLLHRCMVDEQLLRRLGFRISRRVGDQLVIGYKGERFGLIV